MFAAMSACSEPVADPAATPDAPPVVVVGGGPAGLAVALDLPGAVLLEASDRLGGRAPGAPQVMFFPDGEGDSAAEAASDWERLTGAPPTDATLRFLEDSAAVRSRLEELGLAFDLVGVDPLLGRPRYHSTTEPGLADVLVAALPDDVEVRLQTRVTGLRRSGETVTGVCVGDEEIPARAVVIASGGFANRVDLVSSAAAWEDGRWDVGEDGGAWGDALDWAMAEGFGTGELGAIGTHGDVVGLPGEDGRAIRPEHLAGPPPWIWVDTAGERFVDESQTWSHLASGLARARDAWAIAERDALLEAISEAERARVEAALVCADDAAALAASIGVDPDGLQATFEAVSDYRTGGTDPFGRWGGGFPFLLDGPCAFPSGWLAEKNFGGIAVDAQGQVLDASGAPVPGLYAVGEAAGMGAPGLGGAWGFDGSLSAVVWSGWRTADALR